MPLAAGPRAEWTELGEQLIARRDFAQLSKEGFVKLVLMQLNVDLGATTYLCQKVLPQLQA